MKYAVCVIDIGMTNKKISIYDQSLNQIESAYQNFEGKKVSCEKDNKTILCHDIEGMKEWFTKCISDFAKKYPVKAISVTTHGATFVCTDDQGKQTLPCVFYTEDPGEDFQKEFYSLCGSPRDLQKECQTPLLSSMINMAKGIFFAKRYFPQGFAATKKIISYPQFWTYFFTGNFCAERTFLACHTYLWNQNKDSYSSVADKLGIRQLLSDNIADTISFQGTITEDFAKKTGLSQDVQVTAGIHDSNASLLPYLAKENDDFILNSTGTWCVSMHPSADEDFTQEDIGKVVFFNRSALNQKVKTSIFLGGMEFDSYVKLYQKLSGDSDFPLTDKDTIKKLLFQKDLFILPEIVRGSGQFPQSKAGLLYKGNFYPYEELENTPQIKEIICNKKIFIAAVIISLVIQSQVAFNRAGLKNNTKIFTEGGFRKNKMYNLLLSSVLKNNPCFTTDISEATSFGSAMTAVMAMEGKKCRDLESAISIEYNEIPKEDFSDYDEYKKLWLNATQGE
ncbi:FGGY family carbohydrate kinase [Treponema sp.]|uniref:FGGY family carbohydrate kinase n=1 Tax=Treponema sp. TaxID=166 RepID=UPI0025F94D33|nr:FGGY family carbohydrate kinase [Treponema sp.]MCR5217760.1 carbohydrate kinase [Treponema sp.]